MSQNCETGSIEYQLTQCEVDDGSGKATQVSRNEWRLHSSSIDIRLVKNVINRWEKFLHELNKHIEWAPTWFRRRNKDLLHIQASKVSTKELLTTWKQQKS